jgi:hypothetical protein
MTTNKAPELDLDTLTMLELGDLKRTMHSMLMPHRYGAGHTCDDVCAAREASYQQVNKAYRRRLGAALAEKTDLSAWTPSDDAANVASWDAECSVCGGPHMLGKYLSGGCDDPNCASHLD